ncbi:uncharacterized protein B0H18DRAFT_954802 [Fomitopsis serialis]|uniref:uncharacterized protein n=1 Tax=Fomitopsis serialis TaxID=139415 RepID=UPI0020074087|nr:uncharacterized protein B0H18DRAFT_954802 [Neoantrodia serialis]KAH9926132.1 hypothetical protein B0H18DRAFT_954802 [Neoantrodia serialis]
MPRALPAELTDFIIGFHWDDPLTLWSCALTCRTWRSASEYHLNAYHALDIKSVTDLTLLSKRFARPESRRFYRDIREMNILESHERPFVHIVPLCIPGSFVPRLDTLRIWSLRRQGLSTGNQWHRSFFSLLSAYKSVTYLALTSSQFHNVEELRRIIKVLPALEEIELTGVDFPHPPPSLATRLEFGRPLSQENMYMARFPIFQLRVLHTIPSVPPDVADQWYRRLQLDVDGKDDWIHRCLLPKAVSDTSADGAANRLTHSMHLEEVEYQIHVGRDYNDLSLTVQTIVAMLSRGVGQYVSKLCVSVWFLKEDFLPYPDDSRSVVPHPLSREAALVRGALPQVRKVSLDIRNLRIGPGQNVPTPVTSAAARIIPPLFLHWATSGRLSVRYPTFDGQEDSQPRENTD